MPRRLAVIIATDAFVEPGFGHCAFAEAGAKALAEALAAAGWEIPAEYRLFGPHATRAIVESRLQKLRRSAKKGDDVLLGFAGRAFRVADVPYLLCRDSIPDDLPGTAITLGECIRELAASKAARIGVLLDTGSGSVPADLESRNLDSDTVDALANTHSKLSGLLSSIEGELWTAPATLKSTAWIHLIVEGLTGLAAKDNRVSLASLQAYLEAELPRVLRRHGEPGATQSAISFGESLQEFVLAEVARPQEQQPIDMAQLQRVVFRADSTTRVKDLPNFRKTFQIPTNNGPSSRKFVARLASEEVRADLDVQYTAVRDQFNYRRKDLDLHADTDGTGYLKTPDFQYSITAAQDPQDPAAIVWRREVSSLSSASFARGPNFGSVFGKLFDQIALEFRQPVDVEQLVDRLEDRPVKGVKITASGSGDSCDIALAGFAGRVTIDRHSLIVRGRPGNVAGLFEQFLQFLQTFGSFVDRPAIAAASGSAPLTRPKRREQ